MQRPVMDPLYLVEATPKRRRRWAQYAATVLRITRWIGRKLLANPIRFGKPKRVADEPALPRLIRGAIYRLLFLPAVLAFVAAVLVFAGTHPDAPSMVGEPTSRGVYYDPVNFVSDDGTRLHAWLVPVIDARRVNEQKDKILTHKYPAVVLVHDFGQSPHQMLPLLAPLHEDGVIVLAVGLRGVGVGSAAGQTFGVNEARDVTAAVHWLRKTPFVDGNRIAVMGVGTGANATLLATDRDPTGIKALVLADPVASCEEAIATRVGPNRFGFRWMQTVSKWAFEISYRIDADEIDMERFHAVMSRHAVLKLKDATGPEKRVTDLAVEQVRRFIREQLRPDEPAVASME